MSQPGLFDEPRTAPAISPTQARAERIQIVERQEPRQSEPLRNGAHNIPSFRKGDTVTLGGRGYRFHKDCGEFVWLAVLDAGIAGPFYWHQAEELYLSRLKERDALFQSSGSKAERAARIRAAQTRLSGCDLNGPEYIAALGELRAAMRGGGRG